jgi:hypothetical protein
MPNKFKLLFIVCALTLAAPAMAVKHKKKPLPPPLPSLGSTKDFGLPTIAYDPSIFGIEMGSTDFDQALKIIAKEGGQIDAQTYGETKIQVNTLNSHENKEPTIVNKDILLVEFSGLPLDNLVKGRMGFFKNQIYFLYYEFEEKAPFDVLEKQVVAKYGSPHKIGGFPDKFAEWKFLHTNLTLKNNFIGADRMIFTQPELLQQANKSNKELIKEQNNLLTKQQRAF